MCVSIYKYMCVRLGWNDRFADVKPLSFFFSYSESKISGNKGAT